MDGTVGGSMMGGSLGTFVSYIATICVTVSTMGGRLDAMVSYIATICGRILVTLYVLYISFHFSYTHSKLGQFLTNMGWYVRFYW